VIEEHHCFNSAAIDISTRGDLFVEGNWECVYKHEGKTCSIRNNQFSISYFKQFAMINNFGLTFIELGNFNFIFE